MLTRNSLKISPKFPKFHKNSLDFARTVCNSQLTFSTSKYGISQQGRWKAVKGQRHCLACPLKKGATRVEVVFS